MVLIQWIILATLLVVGFATAPVKAAEMHPRTGEQLADDQTFSYRLRAEPSSFDPHAFDDTAGADIIRDLFEGLFNQNEAGYIVPGVASRFDVNADRTVYTFHLRDNAKWSDGKPVTADDFVYAWRRATKSPYSWLIELMGVENTRDIISGDKPPSELGVSALDDLTFEVRLNRSIPYFPQMTTNAATFPVPRWTIETFGKEWTKPDNIVSNGAYVLADHVRDEGSARQRNPHYWDNQDTIIDTVVSYVIGDENEALSLHLGDGLDLTDIPGGQFLSLRDEYPDRVTIFPRNCSYYYFFNLSDSGPEAFRDIRVRKALSYAVDRLLIVNEVLAGGQFPAYTLTPNSISGFKAPGLEIAGLSQSDRDMLAREWLADAGYGPDNPLKFTMIYNTSEGHMRIASAMAQMWKQKLGVDATLENIEWGIFLDTRASQQFDLARGAWCGDYNEASTFLDLVHSQSGYNDGKFANEAVDQLLGSARIVDDAGSIYSKIEEIIDGNVPIIPIYHYTGAYMINPSLKNWPVKNVEQKWYSKNLYKTAP